MLICNCRGIGENAINFYLRNHKGELVRLKEVLAECQKNPNVSCCERKSDCNVTIKQILKDHNDTVIPASNPAPQ